MEQVIFPTAWNDQGTRKTAYADVFLSLASHLGYAVGSSLKVQGAYSFEMSKGGRTVRIGLKSAYDRWLNTASKMVEKVDEVWITTFRWSDPSKGDKVPTHLEVYRISAAALLTKYAKVDKARKAAGRPEAYAFIPLDEAGLAEDTAEYNKAAGYVLEQADLIFSAPLKFSDRGAARVEVVPEATQQASPAQSKPLADVFARAKQLVATELGLDASQVSIRITG